MRSVFVPVLIRNLVIPSYQSEVAPYPGEHTLEMNVEVEELRIEIVLSQPAPPPQYGSSPRRLAAVDTGSEELALPRAETQSTEREKMFPLQARLDGFCTSVAQA